MMRRLKRKFLYMIFLVIHLLPWRWIARWQEARLRSLVPYMARNVPMYRDHLEEAGVDASSIRSLADLPKLPTLSKHDFIGRPREEIVDSSRRIRSAPRMTSGTSGEPFTLLSSTVGSYAQNQEFASFRFAQWRTPRLFNFRSMRIARLKVRTYRQQHNRFFGSVTQYLADPDKTIRSLALFEPDILESYSSLLLDMAKRLAENPSLPRITPRYLVSFGESLSPAARSYIADAFNAEVYDRLGMEEVGSIAIECAEHDGLHINSEAVIVEITDDEGKPIPAGERGHVVVTDLYNYNMPFIRYETGDHGRMAYERCACGLETPRVWIDGRYSAYLTFGSKRIHHLEFDAALDGFMNTILKYQVVKVAEHGIEIRIIAGPRLTKNDEDQIITNVRSYTGPDIDINIKLVDAIDPMPRGKSQIVRDETLIVARP